MFQDLGRPAQSIIVNLTINVRDQNDRAPVFTRSLYTARVPEGNTPVRDISITSFVTKHFTPRELG